MTTTRLHIMFAALFLGACATSTPPTVTYDPEQDMGLLWVKNAAEYRAVSLQAYQSATRALSGFIEDQSWTAIPGNEDLRDLPPAVILDFDETVVSNPVFQVMIERPITQWKLDKWNREHVAIPVPGVVEFVTAAQDSGVTVFFVTNRPCESIPGNPATCPYKDTIVADIRELGIETDTQHVLLSNEHGWNREKLTRRQHIAKNYRVIMLIGDDLSDFIPCTRSKPRTPCSNVATRESRRQKVAEFSEYWGNGWYILPNPMHGSWTSAR